MGPQNLDSDESHTGWKTERARTQGDLASHHLTAPSLRTDQGGVVRVGDSRVSLDLVIEQFERGMTPEEMVRAYDTLALEDVYAAIDYYRRHRDEVQTYLKLREEEAKALREQMEAGRPHITREELLARRRARGKDNAPLGQ